MTQTQTLPPLAEPFGELVRARQSVRQFLPAALSPKDIRAVLEDAQTSPSNSNTQPWMVHLASGDARDRISERMIRAFDDGRDSRDFDFDYGDGLYLERSRKHGASLNANRGVERSDAAARREVNLENLRFYGAPHVAFLFMPQLGDGVRTAGDIGMYAQTFLLSLTARGLHGIPQTVLGFYADEVRETLGISDDFKLLFGISFGSADPKATVNDLRMHRVPLGESVVFHDTPC